jgi:hypothetical protein
MVTNTSRGYPRPFSDDGMTVEFFGVKGRLLTKKHRMYGNFRVITTPNGLYV